MRLTGSRAYYRSTPPKMPPGLVELIEGLTREVLKNNPTDIYGFCASHMQQLLEIRDGLLRKKTLTLQEKIAKAQEKVRQRAEQRIQQYNNDLLNQQSGKGLEVNVSPIQDNTPPILPQEPTADYASKAPIQNEQELVKSSEVKLSHELSTPSGDPQPHVIKEIAIKDKVELKKDIETESMDTKYESKKNINLAASDSVLTKDLTTESSNKTSDSAITQDFTTESSNKTSDSALTQDLTTESSNKTSDSALTQDLTTDSSNKTSDSALTHDLTTESSNKTSDSALAQDLILNELPKADTFSTKVEMLDNLCAPMVDDQITHGGIPLKEDQTFVAEASVLQEFHKVAPDTEHNLSNPINSINTNQVCGLVDNITTILTETEKITDNDINDQNSLTHAVNVISNDIIDTQCDIINLPLNKEESEQSNDTESIQDFVDPDITNRSNIHNVELTTNSDDTVNEKEDPQETSTFDISFKESPTVELQDPQINSDMLESLVETNSDSDIMTLITQESIDDELKEHNGFKHDTNSELPEGKKQNSESNGEILMREELQEDTQNQINNIDLINNNNKETTQIDNRSHEYVSTILGETPQIHNQDSNMDLETAAITIQKVFRTFLFKSRASTFDDTVNDETIFLNEVDKIKEDCDFPTAGTLNKGRPHGITRMDTVLQTVNEEKSLSLSTDDSSTLSSAATVIQAHVRGFLVRNKLNSNKTISTNSLAASNSNEPSLTSLEMDNEQNKNKTVLNIHIVPEGGNYLSRDESLITSMDLSLDSSPPSSINLHPLGYDKSERRKQLKREDAIQSVSPPSNNSGKLSEDVDSVKELPLNDHEITEEYQAENNDVAKDDLKVGTCVEEDKKVLVENMALGKIVTDNENPVVKQDEYVEKSNSDEMDVVSPFILNEENNLADHKLIHSGEFHDAVLPTQVSRSDTSVTSGE